MEKLKQVPFSVLLVTGGCGFIPTNFIDYVLDRPLSSSVKIVNYGHLTPTSKDVNVDSSRITLEQHVFICGDVCNRTMLDWVLWLYNVDAVVHFAAKTHVSDSYKDPQEFVRCNVEGTVTLLEACRAYGHLKRFVYVSTERVYRD